jgi:hypothetical protein
MSVIIHTGFFTDRTENIFESMQSYLLNKWGSRQMNRSANSITIKRDFNNEVILCIDNKSSYYRKTTAFTDKDTKQIKVWIACTLKTMVYRFMKYRESNFNDYKLSKSKRAKANCWNRKNTSDCIEFLNKATVAEIYYIFDSLLNRSKIDKHYDKEIIKNIVGVELDPLTAEMKKAFDEEAQKLRDICTNEISILKKQCEKDIDDYTSMMRAKNRKQVAEREAQLAADIKALESIK